MAKVNLTINPYYDDFNEDKNFHKILFKPGVALQSRELTQVQSILQDQIKKFGGHIFSEGSRVSNTEAPQISLDTKVRAIRLQETYLTNPINVLSYQGLYVNGANSNIVGSVSIVYAKDEPTVDDPPTVLINLIPGYENDGIFTPNETVSFYSTYSDATSRTGAVYSAKTTANTTITLVGTTNINSDELLLDTPNVYIKEGDRVVYTGLSSDLYVAKIEDDNTTIVLNKRPGATLINQNIRFIRENTAKSSIVNVSSGVFYKNGYFIKTGNQKISPSKYNEFTTRSIGLLYNETLVTSDEDISLLDPALETSNYFAEGADRLKITLDIASKILDSNKLPDVDEDYIELGRLRNGIIEYVENSSDYNQIGSYLAKRTYDESGNYTVTPFRIVSTPSGPAETTVKTYITPGQAYVGGYDITTIAPTLVEIDKARSTSSLSDVNILNRYGSYILINRPSFGLFDQRTLTPFWKLEVHTGGIPTSNTSLVGYVTPQRIEYDSGTGTSALYRLYTYFTEPLSANFYKGNTLVCVASSNTNPSGYSGPVNTGSYTTPLFRANISSTGKIAGNIVLYNAPNTSVATDRLIFPAPKTYIKTVTNNRVTYSNVFRLESITSGSTITKVLTGDEQFAGAAGSTLTSTEKLQYYGAVVRQVSTSTTGYNNGDHITIDSNATITLSADAKTLTFALSDATFTGNIDLFVTIDSEDFNRRTKTLIENANATIRLSNSYVWTDIGKSDIADYKGIYRLGSNTFTGEYDVSTTYNANTFVSNAGSIFRSITSSTGIELSNVTYWERVNQEFILDFDFWNGQTDQYYDHGFVRFTGNVANAPGNCVVVFNYYSHSGTGVITAESYPNYDNIPVFTSSVDRKSFPLRDCVDYRPRRIDDTNVYVFSSTEIPKPYSYTESDLEYYMGRVDRLYVQNRDVSDNRKGKIFWVDRGVSSENPITPADNSDSTQMSVATLSIPPYTYRSGDININYTPTNRYTMKDIGSIDTRLSKVEKTVRRHDLEIAGVGKVIYDANLNSLFKTSVFTDDFSDTSRAQLDNYFKATIDTTTRECYPLYDTQVITMEYLSNSEVSVKAELITNKYTEEDFIAQLYPSESAVGHTVVNGVTLGVSGNPGNTFVDVSHVKITPSFTPMKVFYDQQ